MHPGAMWRNAPVFPLMLMLALYQKKVLEHGMTIPDECWKAPADTQSELNRLWSSSKAEVPPTAPRLYPVVPLPPPVPVQPAAGAAPAARPAPRPKRQSSRRTRHVSPDRLSPEPPSPAPQQRRLQSPPPRQVPLPLQIPQALAAMQGATFLHSGPYGMIHVDDEYQARCRTFASPITLNDEGTPMMAEWSMDEAHTTPNQVRWTLATSSGVNTCTWTRVQTPPSDGRHWALQTRLQFLYASIPSPDAYVPRKVKVTGYKQFPDGLSISARTEENESRA
jgi:hypothetical protein